MLTSFYNDKAMTDVSTDYNAIDVIAQHVNRKSLKLEVEQMSLKIFEVFVNRSNFRLDS